MVLDIIDTKIHKRPLLVKKKTQLIFFDNKTIEKINLPRIFHDLLLKVVLPNTSAYFDTPTMIYTLLNPIGFRTSNFNEFVNNLDAEAFLDDNTSDMIVQVLHLWIKIITTL